jgi:hypothetical protein
MHHEQGLDQNAIAERLAIPRTTVATRLFRARLALRTALLQRYGDAGDNDGERATGVPAITGERKAARQRPRTRRRPTRPRLRVHAGGRKASPAPAMSKPVDSAPVPATRTAASGL